MKLFIEPEVKVDTFNTEDIITTSFGGNPDAGTPGGGSAQP